jgi:hypothetical protein
MEMGRHDLPTVDCASRRADRLVPRKLLILLALQLTIIFFCHFLPKNHMSSP